jgi:uncharacterized protein YkwD
MPWIIPFLLSFILFSLPVSGKNYLQGESANTNKPSSPTDRASFSEFVQTIHQKVNAYRVSHGLQSLTLHPLISKLASEHSQAMARGEVPLSHGGFEKRAQRLKKELSYRTVAENVGVNQGYADPARQVVEGWLQSEEHLKNIQGDFELTGIGVAKDERGKYYFTQIFLKR